MDVYLRWIDDPDKPRHYNQWLNENHRRFTVEELEKEQYRWNGDIFVLLGKIINQRKQEELLELWIE